MESGLEKEGREAFPFSSQIRMDRANGLLVLTRRKIERMKWKDVRLQSETEISEEE